MLRRALSVMFLLLGAANCSTVSQPAARPEQVASGPASFIERGPIAQRQSCFCEAECSATAVFYNAGSSSGLLAACNAALAICRNTGCTTCVTGDSFCQ